MGSTHRSSHRTYQKDYHNFGLEKLRRLFFSENSNVLNDFTLANPLKVMVVDEIATDMQFYAASISKVHI